MSGSKRNKEKRNIKIRAIMAVVLLLITMAVFITLGYELQKGMTQQAWLYGAAMITLFMATGMMLSPLLKYWAPALKRWAGGSEKAVK